jgi:hypothetical protein
VIDLQGVTPNKSVSLRQDCGYESSFALLTGHIEFDFFVENGENGELDTIEAAVGFYAIVVPSTLTQTVKKQFGRLMKKVSRKVHPAVKVVGKAILEGAISAGVQAVKPKLGL